MDIKVDPNAPILEAGQVWTVKGREIVIVRVGKHLAEYRDYKDGKVVQRGRAGLKTIRQIGRELLDGEAELTGHVETSQRFL